MLAFLVLCAFCEVSAVLGELWKEDLTSAMKIGLSTKGYKSVDLRCDADHFSVNVTLDEDFQGIVYTRGSFTQKNPPCFKRHDQVIPQDSDKLTIGLRIPFDKCKTVMDVAESRFTNTLVVQHDPDLIMPGDSAFTLDCAFEPEFKDSTVVTSEMVFKSKISLVSADPAEKENLENDEFVVTSKTEKVSFYPKNVKSNDEL